MLVVLGNNLTAGFKAHFNHLASDPASGIEIIPTDIVTFNGDRPRAHHEPDAEFWYKAARDDYEAHVARVKGQPVIYIDSMTGDPGQHFMETAAVVSGLKDELQAGPITAIIPCVPFARQDRSFARDGRISSVMGRTFPKMLHDLGIGSIVTTDLHSRAAEKHYEDVFGAEGASFLSSARWFADDLRSHAEIDPNDVVICAPDGWDKQDDAGQGRARALVTAYHQVASLSPEQEKEWMSGLIKKRTLLEAGKSKTDVKFAFGDVAGKTVVITDDVGDSLGTILQAGRELRAQGAASIRVYLTLQGGDDGRLANLLEARIDGRPVIDHITFTDVAPAIDQHIDLLKGYRGEDGLPKFADLDQRIAVIRSADKFYQAVRHLPDFGMR